MTSGLLEAPPDEGGDDRRTDVEAERAEIAQLQAMYDQPAIDRTIEGGRAIFGAVDNGVRYIGGAALGESLGAVLRKDRRSVARAAGSLALPRRQRLF